MNTKHLTKRQAQVMDMLVAGECNKSIARHLGVGVKTAETHVSKALKALSTDSRVRAAVLWDRWRQRTGSRYTWTPTGMLAHPTGAWSIATDGVGGDAK